MTHMKHFDCESVHRECSGIHIRTFFEAGNTMDRVNSFIDGHFPHASSKHAWRQEAIQS